MIYIREYNEYVEYKSYEEIGESDFLNQDSLHDYDDPRIEVGDFKIEIIPQSIKNKLYDLFHKDNFHNQWIKYINISIVDFSPYRFMVKNPIDVKDRSLFIIIDPEVDLDNKDYLKVDKTRFYIEAFLIEDDYYYIKITSVYPPMSRSNRQELMMYKDTPVIKYFKCDQIGGFIDCAREEITNWYPYLKKIKMREFNSLIF